MTIWKTVLTIRVLSSFFLILAVLGYIRIIFIKRVFCQRRNISINIISFIRARVIATFILRKIIQNRFVRLHWHVPD